MILLFTFVSDSYVHTELSDILALEFFYFLDMITMLNMFVKLKSVLVGQGWEGMQ